MQLHTDLAFSTEQAESLLDVWLGSPVRCTSIQPLKGGMVNTVLELKFDREPFTAVVKLNVAGHTFAPEARALRCLRNARLPCPQVYLEDSLARLLPYSFLLLETLPGVNMWELPLAAEDRQRINRELAHALLGLHSHTRSSFGAISDAAGRSSWADVFLPRLYEVRGQPEIAARLAPAVQRKVDKAILAAERALTQQGPPTLVHGDIWAANIVIEKRPSGWQLSGLVDPKAEYADVEMELAYLQEFSCVVGPEFFAEYVAAAPLRPGYEFRRLFYWLHSYLEHVWLFEDQRFRDKAASVADQILCG